MPQGPGSPTSPIALPEPTRVQVTALPGQRSATVLKILACILTTMMIIQTVLVWLFAARLLAAVQQLQTPAPIATGCAFDETECG